MNVFLLFIFMSMYIVYCEIPSGILQKLLQTPANSEIQRELIDSLDYTPNNEITDVLKAPLMRLHMGKHGYRQCIDDREDFFYSLLSEDPEWDSASSLQISEASGLRYRLPQQLRTCWNIIEKQALNHPIFNIEDMLLNRDDFFSWTADGCDIDAVIRYYYGCTQRGSGDIYIVAE
jgi:hypothetical protein